MSTRTILRSELCLLPSDLYPFLLEPGACPEVALQKMFPDTTLVFTAEGIAVGCILMPYPMLTDHFYEVLAELGHTVRPPPGAAPRISTTHQHHASAPRISTKHQHQASAPSISTHRQHSVHT